MRQTVGFGIVLAVAVAAMGISARSPGIGPDPGASGKNKVQGTAEKHGAGIQHSYRGGCSAYDIEAPASDYPNDNDRGKAKSKVDTFFQLNPDEDYASAAEHRKQLDLTKVHYAIALAADPRHTNLSLMFDRQTVLIQQAAQDEGYTYNSSWFPWRSGSPTTFPLLGNQQQAEDLAEQTEACPGIMLFRKSVRSDQTGSDPYAEALVVFVVGEQPTGGLNENQWANTLLWLNRYASPKEQGVVEGKPDDASPRALRILGPTFSGSLVSLARDLKGLYSGTSTAPDAFPGPNTPVRLLSGVVSGCSSIHWFQHQVAEMKGKVVFGTFNENDEVSIYRFLSYLKSQGTDAEDSVILSEDETAYGDTEKNNSVPLCNASYAAEHQPVRLFYPRDISALRDAYEKQSVFSSGSQAEHAIHPILQEGGAVDGGEAPNAPDTIAVYSGRQTAIAQEALLYGIVSNLRIHHTRYLVLRCTNPLDYLFLTRFFHRAYPGGRIVTIGADILFRREIDTTEFRGVLALSTYPLLPRNQHWAWLSIRQDSPFAHAHRVFESNFEGSYNAARYLFGPQNYTTPVEATKPDESISLPLKEDIPDYADPFWLGGTSTPTTNGKSGPPTWLAVVGRDGYWPIAALNSVSTPKITADAKPPQATAAPTSTLVKLVHDNAHYASSDSARKRFSDQLYLGFPLLWLGFSAAAFLLLLYQTYGAWKGGGLTSSGIFALFRPVTTKSQAALLGMNSAFAAGLLLQLLSIAGCCPSTGLYVADSWVVCACLLAAGAILCCLLWAIGPPFQKSVVVVSFFATLCVVLGICLYASWWDRGAANSFPLFYRMVHLNSGVSPLVPVLFLIFGFYAWTWQCMAGNSLLCPGRPMLPKLAGVNAVGGLRGRYLEWIGVANVATGEGPGRLAEPEYRISSEMERRIVEVASPMSVELRVLLLPGIVLFGAVCYVVAFGPPLLGLEGRAYALSINLALLAAFLLITAEVGRLYFSWVELRRLLAALNRLRLRRTFSKLAAVSPGSLWSVSGGVQRIQYHFFSQQLDAAHRLNRMSDQQSPSLGRAVNLGRDFAGESARHLDTGPQWDSVQLREHFNDVAADVLNQLLVRWKDEEESLNFPERHSAAGEPGQTTFEMELSKDPIVVVAEEFVCLHYIAFIQNILGRIRTMTLSMVSLFVTVCLAISFYPFVPRTQIGMWMIINLILIGAVVIYVYAGMERDETLSHIANTAPGRLGGEFYFKTAGFLAGPVIGLLTTQFPSISESVLGWLQPGLDALK